MNRFHKELLLLFQQQSKKLSAWESKHGQSYIGTTKSIYSLKTPVKRTIVKAWLTKHRTLSFGETIQLLKSLSNGKSHTEFSTVGMFLDYLPAIRRQLPLPLLASWLNKAEGWAEVDGFVCFKAEEMLERWNEWKKFLISLSTNSHVQKCRASLVLLTKPARSSDDTRISNLAFANITRLMEERNILITKAVSWLLRDLIKHHTHEVRAFLEKNKDTLPAIAIRETRNKLKTGRKSGH